MSEDASPHRIGSPAALMDGWSIEMTGRDIDHLAAAAPLLPPGTRVNVTFLGSEDLELRVAAAAAVRQAGLVPVPHISARRIRSAGELEEFLGRLRDVDASGSVFVVAGDPPSPEGPYADARSLLESGLLPQFGVTEVGVAGYPEGHPDTSTDNLWRHLVDKVQLAADQRLNTTVITQFSFDTDPVLRWISEVRQRQIAAPLRIGTPGPAGIRRLLGFARRFGIGANAMIVKKYGFSLTNLMGTAGPDRFVGDLAAGLARDEHAGAVHLHLYAFGGLETTARWARDFTAGGHRQGVA